MRLLSRRRVALLAVLVSGCTLLQLDDFERPRCQSDADCAEHTRATGADPARCRVFLCNPQSGHCERAAAPGAERCDGEDNNCDANGFIDEGAPRDEPERIDGDADLSDMTLAYAPGPKETAYAVVLGRSAATGYRAGDGLQQRPVPLAFAWEGSEADQKSCPTADGQSTLCTFEEVALAAGSEQLVTVAISKAGCAHGKVRIGTSTPDEPFKIWLGSEKNVVGFERSSIARGVDVEVAASGLLCTGASRPEAAERGATLPAVASLEGSATQALALWLATPSKISANSDACLAANNTVPVEALGVFASNAWIEIEATWQGRPEPIGLSAMRSAPAVIALRDVADANVQQSAALSRRFLVAFAVNDEEEPLPPPAAGRRLQFSAVTFAPDPNARLHFEIVGSLSDAGAHQVALSEGAEGRIGAVWRSGCGGEVALRFAELTWTSDRNLVAPPPTELAVGDVVRGPFLLYSPDGFRVGRASGGWLVMWVERTSTGETELKLARVPEHNSTPLETLTLATGRVELTFPHRMFPNENDGSTLDDEKSSIVGYTAIVDPGSADSVPKARSAQCADRG